MAQYIDKDALVQYLTGMAGCVCCDENVERIIRKFIIPHINTLEVKEVDLEKELIAWHKKHFKKDGTFIGMSGFYLTNNSQMDIAKHFFELGIKAQHDNWKVVDNINSPQADRNKIYCVFTKQHYILAKVTNHPKDEELLQWKCTEFPHHCYDMCEGDEYMPIV